MVRGRVAFPRLTGDTRAIETPGFAVAAIHVVCSFLSVRYRRSVVAELVYHRCFSFLMVHVHVFLLFFSIPFVLHSPRTNAGEPFLVHECSVLLFLDRFSDDDAPNTTDIQLEESAADDTDMEAIIVMDGISDAWVSQAP